MLFPHLARNLISRQPILTLLVVTLTVVSAGATAGQDPAKTGSAERQRGIQLYGERKDREAIQELRNAVKEDKDDADAWYYLGLALVRVDDMKAARKAFESAVKLKPNFAPAHTGFAYASMASGKDGEVDREAATAIRLNPSDAIAHYLLGVVELRDLKPKEALEEAETSVTQKPDFGPAYLLKSQALLGLEGAEAEKFAKVLRVPADGPPTDAERQERLEHAKRTRELFGAAATALEKYLKLVASDSETATWKEQLETLQIFAASDKQSSWHIYNGNEVTTKVKVLSKPEPTYTEQARHAGVSGTIVLRAIFSATGSVDHILVLRSLPGGLTGQAIAAARKIRFTPAIKDGKPVSTMMELQYNFSVF
jgi:TonB family protein